MKKQDLLNSILVSSAAVRRPLIDTLGKSKSSAAVTARPEGKSGESNSKEEPIGKREGKKRKINEVLGVEEEGFVLIDSLQFSRYQEEKEELLRVTFDGGESFGNSNWFTLHAELSRLTEFDI